MQLKMKLEFILGFHFFFFVNDHSFISKRLLKIVNIKLMSLTSHARNSIQISFRKFRYFISNQS